MATDLEPKEALETMLGHLGFVFEVEQLERNGTLVLNIRTRDPGRLIGRNGKTLDEIQFLLNRILSAGEDDAPRVTVDVENYRDQQVHDLANRALELARQVLATGKEARIGPLNSFDRRIVHTTVQQMEGVETISAQTQDRLKVVIIRPAGVKSVS